MLSNLFPAILVALLAFQIYLTGKWADNFSKNLNHASEQLDAFFKIAQGMIKDPQTPESIVNFISGFAEHVISPGPARRFTWSFLKGKLGVQSKTRPDSQFARDLRQLTARQFVDFNKLVVAGLHCSAASSPIFSGFFSAVLTEVLSTSGDADDHPSKDRVKTIAIGEASHNVKHHRELVAA